MSAKKTVRSLSPARSNTFDRNLNLYSLAAAAAGVGMLALAAPAEGKVVVTTKTISIPFNQLVSLDINGDGITDFQFSLYYQIIGCGASGRLTIPIPKGNAVIDGTLNHADSGFVSALVRGARIGPSANFVANYGRVEGSLVFLCSGSDRRNMYGQWGGNPPNRYVGVKFLIHGATHYGWIRLSANFPASGDGQTSATITAYAYETVPNKPIKAGSRPTASVDSVSDLKTTQPSLGMLAVGTDGLAIWRREEELT
ncbi:MAG: hypothetical protein ACRD3B_02710 [Candidatus Sulfotelmatobacter sp.]